MPLVTPPIKNIKDVTEPLKEEILKGNVHTIEEMKVWLEAFGYSDAIKDATINAILREFVMNKVSCDEMINKGNLKIKYELHNTNTECMETDGSGK